MNFDDDKKKSNPYEPIIIKTFKKIKEYTKLTWNFSKEHPKNKNIKIYTTTNVKNAIKIEALLECKKKHLFLLCTDLHLSSRSIWDSLKYPHFGIGNIHKLTIHDTMLDNKIDKSNSYYIECILSPKQSMVDYRYFQGIQWDRKGQKDIILFRSCQSDCYKPPKDINIVESKVLMGCWIKEISDEKVFFTQIIQADFGDWLPMNHNILLDRVLFLQQQASNDNLMITIFHPWNCSICIQKNILYYILECPFCKTERYGRCSNKQCYRPTLKDELKCIECGWEVDIKK